MDVRQFAAKAWRQRPWLSPENFVRSLGVSFGSNCRFIAPTASTFGSEPYLIRLGDHVTVGSEVRFITHDGGVWVLRDDHPNLDVIAPILVQDNVFIGSRVVVLPGVTIGSNSVVGAGSVVTRDVPSDVVVAGVPAQVRSTLEKYRKRSDANGVETKGLSPADKKRALLSLFDDRLQC